MSRHAPSGALSFDTVAQHLSASRTWFASGAEVDIDLAGVSHADSAGLALLVEWARLARQAHGAVRFINTPMQIDNLIRVAGLKELLAAPAE